MKILKIHTLQRGWCDKDHIMLHAAFQLLVDFVEKEEPGETIDWNADPDHRQAWKEIRALYKWWTEARATRRDPLDAEGLKHPPLRWKTVAGSSFRQLVDYDKSKYPEYEKAMKQHQVLERKWEAEDQKNLHRLVDIRGYLWT